MFQMQIERDTTITRWHVPLLNLLIRLVPKGPECSFHYGLFLSEAAPRPGGVVCQLPRAKWMYLC